MMYYAIYIRHDRHWRMHNKKPTQNRALAMKTFRLLKGYSGNPVLVISNTDPRLKDTGLRFVVALTKNNTTRKRD